MKTRYFKRKFLTSGIVGYNDTNEGNLLLKKSVIDNALDSLIKKPVIITHDGKETVGEVVDCYFNPEDDNFICGFNVWNEEAIDLLDNSKYGISCTYNILQEKKDGGIYHNIPYESEAEAIDFVNIAIVENPRYEEAREVLNSILENGGAGSGNWGHSGRPGKLGGSGKSQTTSHTKERRAYGIRLRELVETFKADNVSKKYKEKANKLVKEVKKKSVKPKVVKPVEKPTTSVEDTKSKLLEDTDYLASSGVGFYNKDTQKKITDVAGRIQTRPEGLYMKGDNKRTFKVIETAIKQANDPNYKPEFETITTTLRGAKLIKKDGKIAWVRPGFIRKDGSLTAGGLKALEQGISEKAYNTMQEVKQNKIQIVKEAKDKVNDMLISKYNYNPTKDKSDEAFIDMKKRALAKYKLSDEILNEEFTTPASIKNILKSDPSAYFTANYWETPTGDKKRIYFNVENASGYKYQTKDNYINL